MLDKPEHGWVDFTLPGGDSYSMSYLTWIADEWLDKAIQGLRTRTPFEVEGYMEPGSVFCLVNGKDCTIRTGAGRYDRITGIETDEAPCTVPYTMHEFCKALHDDVQQYLDEWVHWKDNELTAKAHGERER